MLLLQTSPHCQSPRPSKSGIILVPVKAFEFLHGQGRPSLLPINCHKTTLLKVEWRQGNQVLPWRKRSDWKARQMRYINAVLAMEPGTTYNTTQATVNHHTPLSTNSSMYQEQDVTASSNKIREVSVFMGTAHNQPSFYTAMPSAGTTLLKKMNSMRAEKQVQEEKEIARRMKISKANKGRVPWNKGKNGDCMTIDEGSTPQKKVKALLSVEEKENLRRQRISEANRGKVPWNKGGKHSSETKHRIRVGVIERMKDPKIREKLRLQAEAVKLSPEIKLKIRNGIIRAWNLKRKLRAKQELCLLEWKEVIAETARRGCEGEVEYEWDSYSSIKREALYAVTRMGRGRLPRPDHLSAEHRLRISAAIKAKWSNPDYRFSVQKGIRNSVSKRVIPPRQMRPKAEPRRTFSRPSDSPTIPQKSNRSRSNRDLIRIALDDKGTRKSAPKRCTSATISNRVTNPSSGHGTVGNLKRASSSTELMESDFLKLNTDMPIYKDPETREKLEKLKSMRARRMHVEAQKQKEITERARALIAQAQEAAKALEATAVKDKNALAPLLETRKLLAEAVHSLESLNWKKSTPDHIIREDNSALYAQVMSLANAVSSPTAKRDNHPEWESTNVEF